MSEQGQSSPAATLAALPSGLRRDLERFAEAIQAPLPKEGGARRAKLLAADEEGELLAQGLIQALDGQSAAQLEEVLDWLREHGVYDVSTALLEAAWGLDLPLDLLGRIAEDWIGAVFFGIGDRAGAEEVARHLVPRAKALGPAFANDLSHFLMSLKLREAARPLVHFAGASLPGDDSARFHLGIMHKFDGEWAESARCFEEILERREDQASRWNLAIARVALRDWEAARESWSALQIQLPPGDGDYATAGEPCPIRLPTPADAPIRSEVIWAKRLGPARVRLEGFPCFHDRWTFGDVLLIDGEPEGEVSAPDGQRLPIVTPLDRFERSLGKQHRLFGARSDEPALRRLDEAVEALNREGWPSHNGSATRQLAGLRGHSLELFIYQPSQRSDEALQETLRRHLDPAFEFSLP